MYLSVHQLRDSRDILSLAGDFPTKGEGSDELDGCHFEDSQVFRDPVGLVTELSSPILCQEERSSLGNVLRILC